MKDSAWGVVQELVVEADTHIALVSALTIAMTNNRQVTHWKMDDKSMVLLWASGDGTHILPSPLKDPQKVAQMIEDWLKDSAAYPDDAPDTDGSVKEGYRVEMKQFCEVCRITPTWIVYGK